MFGGHACTCPLPCASQGLLYTALPGAPGLGWRSPAQNCMSIALSVRAPGMVVHIVVALVVLLLVPRTSSLHLHTPLHHTPPYPPPRVGTISPPHHVMSPLHAYLHCNPHLALSSLFGPTGSHAIAGHYRLLFLSCSQAVAHYRAATHIPRAP